MILNRLNRRRWLIRPFRGAVVSLSISPIGDCVVFVSIRNSSQDMVLCLSVFWVLLEASLLHLFSIEGDVSDQCLELWLLYLSVLFMKVWLAKKVYQAQLSCLSISIGGDGFSVSNSL